MRTITFSLNLIILFLSSCVATQEVDREKLLGKYIWSDGFVGSSIKLNPDSTFVYNYYADLLSGTTEGKWKLAEKTLILNSEKQPEDEFKFRILPKNQSSLGELNIKVRDEYKESLIGAVCMLIRDTTVLTGTSSGYRGYCKLPYNQEATKLKVQYIGYHTVEVPLNVLTSNSFTLEIGEQKGYRYFIHEEWKIKSRKLFDPEMEEDFYTKNNYYEKVKE